MAKGQKRSNREQKKRNCSPPPGSIEIMFIKGLSIQAGSEPILSILERSAWGELLSPGYRVRD